MRSEPDRLPAPAPDTWPVGKKSAFFTLFLSVLFIILDFMDRQVLAALFLGPLINLDFTVTADLSLPHQRGTSISRMIATQSILGMAVGPLFAGVLSDHRDRGSSLIAMSGFFVLSGLCYIGVSQCYNRDFARMPRMVAEF